MSEFCVYRVRDVFHCEETREANPRQLRHSEDELTMHQLNRSKFYKTMADDLGIIGNPAEITAGIWEVGRRNMPGQGRAKVFYVEHGVGDAEITACIAIHGFKLNCVLFCEKTRGSIYLPDKHIQLGQIVVQNECFFTEAFQDIAAAVPDLIAETTIDMDSTPQRVVILGEEFSMPLYKSKPLIGLKYLSMLFDRPRETISAWNVFLAGHPGDASNAEDNFDDVDDLRNSEEVFTGMSYRDIRAEIRPMWDDSKMDSKTRKSIGEDLIKKKKSLQNLLNKKDKKSSEVSNLKKEIEELQKYLNSGEGADGRKRSIKHSDRDRARDSVRGGIGIVIKHISKQNPIRAKELINSIDFGYDLMFKPPPDWGI
jgi:hypothetical protein